jgi:hypothetical protein
MINDSWRLTMIFDMATLAGMVSSLVMLVLLAVISNPG